MNQSETLKLVLALLPDAEQRIDEHEQWVELRDGYESETGIVVRVGPGEAVELRLPSVLWAPGPVQTTKLWRRIEIEPGGVPEIESLTQLIKSARRARKRQWSACQFCGDRSPTEHKFDPRTCYGCATNHFGVIY